MTRRSCLEKFGYLCIRYTDRPSSSYQFSSWVNGIASGLKSPTAGTERLANGPLYRSWSSGSKRVLPCSTPKQSSPFYKSVVENESRVLNIVRVGKRSYSFNNWNPRGSGYQRFETQGGEGSSWRRARNQRIIIAAGVGGFAIWVSSRQQIPYTGRYHSILVDTETERILGEQTFNQILMDAKASKKLISPTHPSSRMVRKVGERIAAVATDGYGGGFQDQMKGIKWEFAVIRSPEVNAFVVPGGKVVVYSGLLNLVSSEDELAAVLAHEVAHVLARHAAERITQGSVIELLRMIAYIAFGIPIFSGPLQALFFLPNSRSAETEADTIGVQLAARACYDPAAAATVFLKLGREEAKSGVSIPKFLRTHPVTKERVENIEKLVPKASQLGELEGCHSKRDFLIDFERTLSGFGR